MKNQKQRRLGQFYTPTQFVDYAHKMISAQLGEDWREKYVVIDCACGTKNLTRDYYFRELYCSTLEQAELDISKAYSPEATSFQFDFLNDPLENLPDGLLKAFEEKKPIVWLINPPYLTANKANGGKGSISSAVNMQMKADDIGLASQEMSAQFMYRIMKIKEKYGLTDYNIALFCKPKFMTGSGFKKFRASFLREFKFEKGILFNAGHFANVSANWGITFNIWSSGNSLGSTEFKHTLIDRVDGELIETGTKTLYCTDGVRSYKEFFEFGKCKAKHTLVHGANMLNALVHKDGGKWLKAKDSIGYIVNHGFAASQFGSYTYMFSDMAYGAHGTPIFDDNGVRCLTAYAVQKLVEVNWINDKDELMHPDTSHPKYQEFENDALVYSIFCSLASSLRKINANGHAVDVNNFQFWLSKDQIKSWADEASLDFTFNDATASDERFLFKKLQSIKLSPEAQEVLDKASELVHASMKYRALLDSEMPECQMLNWDAGWYQVKKLLKKYMPEELKAFKAVQKKLEEKMRPMVYELGFLKRS